MCLLFTHEPGSACAALDEVWTHTQREGVVEPGVFPVAPDLVEALAESGNPGAASVITSRLRELTHSQGHPWGLATTLRCESLVKLTAASYDERAAAGLEQAAAEYGSLELHFDRARSPLSLGRAQRRFKKWGRHAAPSSRLH